jgi:hypothetical protein
MCIERITAENRQLEEESRRQFQQKLNSYQGKSAEDLNQDMEGCIIVVAK